MEGWNDGILVASKGCELFFFISQDSWRSCLQEPKTIPPLFQYSNIPFGYGLCVPETNMGEIPNQLLFEDMNRGAI